MPTDRVAIRSAGHIIPGKLNTLGMLRERDYCGGERSNVSPPADV